MNEALIFLKIDLLAFNTCATEFPIAQSHSETSSLIWYEVA